MIEDHKQFYAEGQTTDAYSSDWFSAPNVVKTDKDFLVKNFFSINNNEVAILKGQKFNRTAFSTLVSGSTYSTSATDYLIAVTSLSYAPTIGLPRPSIVGPGKTFVIKDETGSAASTTITVRSMGEENIDGAATATIVTNYGARSFYSNGANWFIY